MTKQKHFIAHRSARLGAVERDLLIFIHHLPSPASIDTLVQLSGLGVTGVLNAIETLTTKGFIFEKKGHGKGFYFANETSPPFLGSDEHDLELIRKIIGFYENSPERTGEDETILLAQLYLKTGDKDKSFPVIIDAAHVLCRTGREEAAAACYDYILDLFANRAPSNTNVDYFLESVIGREAILTSHTAPEEQLAVLEKARKTAGRFRKWGHLARLDIILARTLQMTGEHEKAARCYQAFLKQAGTFVNIMEHRAAVFAMCEYLFWKGTFGELISQCEKSVGNLEDFGEDAASLKTAALAGFSLVVCGRVSRGLGLIDMVLSKGKRLGLQQVTILSLQMMVLALFELRKTTEVVPYLEELNAFPDSALGPLMVRGVYEGLAYMSCLRGNYALAFEQRKKSLQCARSFRVVHHPVPWVFECLDILEAKGFADDEVTYDSEIKRLVKWDDKRMKGAAFRYRALRNMEENQSAGSVLSDLRKSETSLKQSGAEIELARTRIALGRYYLAGADQKAARGYLEKAWAVLSRIDRNLFPKNLLASMPDERKIEAVMEGVIEINESLGAWKDSDTFVEKMIEVAMDYVMATRGAFVIFKPNYDVRKVITRNIDGALIERKRLRELSEIIMRAAYAGRVLIVPSPSRDGEYSLDEDQGKLEKIFREAGVRSFVGVPQRFDEETYGMLLLDNLIGSESFSEYQLPFVRFFCSQIRVGLASFDIYREMKELKERFQEEATFYKREMGVAASVDIMAGKSEGTKEVINQIRQVAPTNSSVMVLGETGVGKELVAKAIHNLSARKNGPFIPVNIATLPPELVASELFGHEKGAFTGANEQKKGRFELANGGTIFLDEIGDLPLQVQTKLLRVLQEGTFERLGSAKAIKSDFRVIAATNKDLDVEVKKGNFRQDLYYRLHVFPILVPPLRSRREDIPVLARYFLHQFGRKLGKIIKRIPPEEMRTLTEYAWPGNVRELQHCIEKALILTDGSSIAFPDLAANRGTSATSFQTLPLIDMEKGYIEHVLTMTRGKVMGPGGAADILKLKPTTLFSRMKKLGIDKNRFSSVFAEAGK